MKSIRIGGLILEEFTDVGMTDKDGDTWRVPSLMVKRYEHLGWTRVDERIATDPNTGGQKGRKQEEYALIPGGALAEVARVYGMGADKYEPWNWTRGYPWSWSYSALMRHIEAHRGGESNDPESGFSHLAHAVFHLFTLMEFESNELGTDDRWKP